MCFQIFVLVVYLLAGAYGTPFFVDLRNPLAVFQSIFAYVTFYAPLFFAVYVSGFLFLKASEGWSWKWLARLRVSEEKGFSRRRCTFLAPLMFFSSNMVFRFPIPPVWEGFLPFGQYLTIYPVGILVLISVPWGLVLNRKLYGPNRIIE